MRTILIIVIASPPSSGPAQALPIRCQAADGHRASRATVGCTDADPCRYRSGGSSIRVRPQSGAAQPSYPLGARLE